MSVKKNKKINRQTKGEIYAKKLFKERLNLDLQKIPETTIRTPDYYLEKAGIKIAKVEIKDLDEVYPTDKNSRGYKKNQFGVWSRNDNSASRISKKINEAYNQLFKTESKLPKIIILVNYALDLDVLDLKGTLDGFLMYASKAGMSFKNFAPYHKISSVIKEKIKSIDVFVWIETNNKKIDLFKYDIMCFDHNNILKKILK